MRSFPLLLLVAWPTVACSSRLASYSDFPAALYKGRITPVRIVSHDDHEFRTMLRDASGQAPNFAGHYVLTSWGCGSPCIQTVAIDVRTGRTSWLPFTLCCWPTGVDDPRQFRRDSRLLLLRGQRDETGPDATWDVLIDDWGFPLLGATPPAPLTAGSARTR